MDSKKIMSHDHTEAPAKRPHFVRAAKFLAEVEEKSGALFMGKLSVAIRGDIVRIPIDMQRDKVLFSIEEMKSLVTDEAGSLLADAELELLEILRNSTDTHNFALHAKKAARGSVQIVHIRRFVDRILKRCLSQIETEVGSLIEAEAIAPLDFPRYDSYGRHDLPPMSFNETVEYELISPDYLAWMNLVRALSLAQQRALRKRIAVDHGNYQGEAFFDTDPRYDGLLGVRYEEISQAAFEVARFMIPSEGRSGFAELKFVLSVGETARKIFDEQYPIEEKEIVPDKKLKLAEVEIEDILSRRPHNASPKHYWIWEQGYALDSTPWPHIPCIASNARWDHDEIKQLMAVGKSLVDLPFDIVYFENADPDNRLPEIFCSAWRRILDAGATLQYLSIVLAAIDHAGDSPRCELCFRRTNRLTKRCNLHVKIHWRDVKILKKLYPGYEEQLNKLEAEILLVPSHAARYAGSDIALDDYWKSPDNADAIDLQRFENELSCAATAFPEISANIVKSLELTLKIKKTLLYLAPIEETAIGGLEAMLKPKFNDFVEALRAYSVVKGRGLAAANGEDHKNYLETAWRAVKKAQSRLTISGFFGTAFEGEFHDQSIPSLKLIASMLIGQVAWNNAGGKKIDDALIAKKDSSNSKPSQRKRHFDRAEAQALIKEGGSLRKVGTLLGVSRTAIFNALRSNA